MKPWLCAALVAALGFAASRAQDPADNAVLLGKLAPKGLNGYTDIWGYAAGDREYALLGHFAGTSIIDVTNPASPKEVAFVNGPLSGWRDLKTHAHYACVTHEQSAGGLEIIDLSVLPASAHLAATYNATFETAHNLYIDNGYAYLAGSNTARGVHILDLQNPLHPVEVGRWDENYWHDVIVLRDTLYGSAIGQINGLDIVDGRNKSRLRLISRTRYPKAFTHNIWMSADNKYLSQTDEVWDQPVNLWDVSNPAAPQLVATYLAGRGAIAPNTHLRGDFAFISYLRWPEGAGSFPAPRPGGSGAL